MLGLLSLGEGTGYDLKRRAESSIGHFWAESYGQIYPTLKQLEAEGLATCTTEPPQANGRPVRIVYAITEAGLAELKAWLAVPPRLEPFRSELLLKLFFGSVSGPKVHVAHLQRLRDEETARLARYRQIESELERRYARSRGLPYWLMTLSYGRHRSQAVVDWIDETLGRMTHTRAGARA